MMEETSYEQSSLRFICRHGESKSFLGLHYNLEIDSMIMLLDGGDC
jgi:hypothetical protein